MRLIVFIVSLFFFFQCKKNTFERTGYFFGNSKDLAWTIERNYNDVIRIRYLMSRDNVLTVRVYNESGRSIILDNVVLFHEKQNQMDTLIVDSSYPENFSFPNKINNISLKYELNDSTFYNLSIGEKIILHTEYIYIIDDTEFYINEDIKREYNTKEYWMSL